MKDARLPAFPRRMPLRVPQALGHTENDDGLGEEGCPKMLSGAWRLKSEGKDENETEIRNKSQT